MKIREYLANGLLRLAFWVMPTPPEDVEFIHREATKHVINKSAPEPIKSAVVVANDTPLTWQPEQHGNVVIAEPDIMSAHRRGDV